LLVRVKARDGEAWRRLAYLYSPMVYRWARKAGLQAHDAQEVVQNVFLAVASDIDHFRRGRPGDRFRGWLWTIARHKILDQFRERQQRVVAAGGSTAQHRLQQFALPEPDSADECSERCRLRHRALAALCDQFDNHAWQAFLRTVVHGDRPVDVASDLGVSVATVDRARIRVLARLRTELEGL
jgi:RNA polymerase sigma-70 factor (ECF subfamily)